VLERQTDRAIPKFISHQLHSHSLCNSVTLLLALHCALSCGSCNESNKLAMRICCSRHTHTCVHDIGSHLF